jgi:plastocyanin
MFSYVATAATVVIAAAMIAVGAPSASAAPRVINVSASFSGGFSPKTIDVKAGEQVSICLKVTDMPHDITIADPAFKVFAPKVGTPTCKTLTAPASGSHAFKCSISGHQGMTGNLVVGNASAAAPAAPVAGAAAPQVGTVPAGGVQTGGGSTAGLTHVNLLMLGGGLLIAAMMSVLFGTRVARRD